MQQVWQNLLISLSVSSSFLFILQFLGFLFKLSGYGMKVGDFERTDVIFVGVE